MPTKALIITTTIFLSSCGYFLTDHKYDYLKETEEAALSIPGDISTIPIIDYYPINSTQTTSVGD